MSRSRTHVVLLAVALVAGLAWLAWSRSEIRRAGAIDPGPDAADLSWDAASDGEAVELEADPVERAAIDTAPSAETLAASHADATPMMTVQLRVLHAVTDEPIAGATVTTFEDSAADARETDQSGACRLRVPSSSEPMRLRIEREGYFHVEAHTKRTETMEVHLAPAAMLTGRILAADTGLPVAGAAVSLFHPTCNACEPTTLTSGADGRYEIAAVPLRTPDVTLLFRAEGFPGQHRDFEIRSDETRIEQDFRLERGLGISGRVVDMITGEGIPDARVGEIPTDASGAFAGKVLPLASGLLVELSVEAPGYCLLRADLEIEQLEMPLEFPLPRAAVVEGVVQRVDGSPIAGASVDIELDHRGRNDGARPETPLDQLPKGWRLEPEGYHSDGSADERGRFRIANVVPWRDPLILGGSADGFSYGRTSIDRIGGPGEVTWAVLVLHPSEPEGHVEGRLSLNGAPLRTANGKVHWRTQNAAGEGDIYHGRFHLGVEPGELSMRVEVEGLPSNLEGAETTVRVQSDSRVETRIQLRMPTKPIAGRVTFHDGRPAAGAAVGARCRLHDDGEGYWERLHLSTEAGPDGTYLLEVPDWDRSYRVCAEMHHDEVAREQVVAGATDIDLVLSVPGRVRFRLIDATSRALLHPSLAELSWRRAGDAEFMRWDIDSLAPDPDGWFEDWLPSGSLDLRGEFGSSDYRVVRMQGVLIPASGEPARIEFAFEKGFELELFLADGQPPPPREQQIILVEEDSWEKVTFDPRHGSWLGARLDGDIRSRLVSFGEGRTAEVFLLAPGRYRFKVFPSEIAIEPEHVEIVHDQPAPVEIRWRRVE